MWDWIANFWHETFYNDRLLFECTLYMRFWQAQHITRHKKCAYSFDNAWPRVLLLLQVLSVAKELVLCLCRYFSSRKEFHTALGLTSLCRGKLYMGWSMFRRHTGWGCQVRPTYSTSSVVFFLQNRAVPSRPLGFFVFRILNWNAVEDFYWFFKEAVDFSSLYRSTP